MYPLVTKASLSFGRDLEEQELTAGAICDLAVVLYCNATGENQDNCDGTLLFDGRTWGVVVESKRDRGGELICCGNAIYRVDAHRGGIDIALTLITGESVTWSEKDEEAAN